MPKKRSPLRALTRTQNSIAKRLLWRDHLAEAIAELARLKRELPTTEMMMTIPYLFQGKGHFRTLELKQNMTELLGLVNLLRKQKLQRVCEIGTFKGGTLFIWCQLAAPDAQIISLDLPGPYNEKHREFFDSFRQPGQRLDQLLGSSHEADVRERFKQTLGNAELDFLFIDGDHSYDGVRKDYEFYSRFVRRGGVIGFHDIVRRDEQPWLEVHKFWAELKTKHRHEEFIETTSDRRKIGIGVLFKD
ncbi:MAG: class I SAM-dependent methyltransferase [Verrucomicrobia bacterium]|nr:class I SAM-dependent methyltransferase [Verrucomicrobiota bacterium]